ncbi:SCO3374 family protein [Streptomyces sp. SID4982]|uniref:SCO3374 family protein n=1 Tax=Streptomyces sp. SID4982 TaxID=2690291 RepID=UPI001928EFAD|nr:SCO3374 family protein [Streptomyces sp. SID4982]
MAGSIPPASSALPFPRPRRPLGPAPEDAARHWYERVLGWATEPGAPLRLVTGVRFDVLDVPAEAGAVALRHLASASPVALGGGRMRLLVAAGSAEELPGLLDWLEWGPLALDLRALGAGDLLEAPAPPVRAVGAAVPRPGSGPVARAVQGAAVWLRPPEPGCDVEAVLPALPSFEGVTGAPDLVRLVDTVAAQCHRVRLRRMCAEPPVRGRDQPLAFS